VVSFSVAKSVTSTLLGAWDDTGYGYQWWINPDGSYRAIGIHGQMIFLDPKLDVVIVTKVPGGRPAGIRATKRSMPLAPRSRKR
jgi:CubicO group peptidase (beta-lactamase class C family)